MARGGQGDVDGGDPDGHPERRTGVLEGVEAAQQQVLGGVRDQAEPEGLEHVPGGRGRGGVHGAVRQQELGGLRAEGEEEEGGRDDDDAADAQRTGEVTAQLVQTVIGDRAAHPGQQRGHQRDGDDRLRQRPDELGEAVGGDSHARGGELLVGCAGVVRDDDHRRQVGEHEQQGPAGGRDALAQTGAAPVEARPEAETGGAGEGDQGEALHGDATGGDKAQEVDLAGGDVLDAVGPGQQSEVDSEHRDQHDVVEDRRPHHRAELAPGVEDLAEDEEQAVEEHLRQQEAREDHGELEGGVVAGRVRYVEGDDLRRCPDRERRAHRQHAQDEGDQALFVGPAAVRVLVPGTYQLRHQHRVQRAADQQGVDAHRDHVGGVVCRGEQAGAECGRLEHLPDQPRAAGDHGPQRHQERGALQAPALASPFAPTRAVPFAPTRAAPFAPTRTAPFTRGMPAPPSVRRGTVPFPLVAGRRPVVSYTHL